MYVERERERDGAISGGICEEKEVNGVTRTPFAFLELKRL